jgi:hypothetical protein
MLKKPKLKLGGGQPKPMPRPVPHSAKAPPVSPRRGTTSNSHIVVEEVRGGSKEKQKEKKKEKKEKKKKKNKKKKKKKKKKQKPHCPDGEIAAGVATLACICPRIGEYGYG